MRPTVKTMQGKTCLITGATSGLGLVTARELARRGAHVVLVGRNPAKTSATVADIRADTGNLQVEFLLADLSSQQQIRNLAQQFKDRYPRLDVLVNNAGGAWMERQVTVDGLEMTLAVNHLAYYLLTRLLVDTLKATPGARVVNMASNGHRFGRIDFTDLQVARRRYNGHREYGNTKLMNLLFTYELARKLAGTGVTVNAVHPGWVATNIAGNFGWRKRFFDLGAAYFGNSPEEGAVTAIYLASSPKVAGLTGGYYGRKRAISSSAASRDVATAQRLWQVSADLTGLAPGI